MDFQTIVLSLNLSPVGRLFLLRQVVLGIEELHSKGFAHRDLKPKKYNG